MRRVAVIEDDPVLGGSIVQRLRLEGFDPALYPDGRSALADIGRRPPALVLCDVRLPDMDGERLMNAAFGTVGAVPTIFMTAYGDFEQAVRLVRQGARDYLAKPFDLDELVERIAAFTAEAEAEAEPPPAGRGGAATAGTDAPAGPSQTVAAGGPAAPGGSSPAMARVRDVLARAARVDTPVLLTGETGTGKEVAARFLGATGRGAGRPFVPVNAAALGPELVLSQLFGHEKGAFTGAHARRRGLVEEAGDGTLFLDEVGELPLPVQAQLLRLLEERAFTRLGGTAEIACRARFVFATNRDLAAEVAAGRFRQDLYYRIGVIECRLPPLRERPEEIPELLAHFVGVLSRRLGRSPAPAIAPALLEAACAFPWPGNVRELKNRVERALALSDGPVLGIADLFPDAATAWHAPPPGLPAACRPTGAGASAPTAGAAAGAWRRVVASSDGGSGTGGASDAGRAAGTRPPVLPAGRDDAAAATSRPATTGPPKGVAEGGEVVDAAQRADPAAGDVPAGSGAETAAGQPAGPASGPAASGATAANEASAASGSGASQDPPLTLAQTRARAEAAHIRHVLRSTGNHVGRTARLLGISRTTLWEKMRAYGLSGD